MQSLAEIELRAPAVGRKLVFFLYVTLGLSARGGHSSNKYSVTVYGSILMSFSAFFFRMDCSVRCTTTRLSFMSPDGATIFAKLPSKNYEKSKNRQKSLCAPLRIDS